MPKNEDARTRLPRLTQRAVEYTVIYGVPYKACRAIVRGYSDVRTAFHGAPIRILRMCSLDSAGGGAARSGDSRRDQRRRRRCRAPRDDARFAKRRQPWRLPSASGGMVDALGHRPLSVVVRRLRRLGEQRGAASRERQLVGISQEPLRRSILPTGGGGRQSGANQPVRPAGFTYWTVRFASEA